MPPSIAPDSADVGIVLDAESVAPLPLTYPVMLVAWLVSMLDSVASVPRPRLVRAVPELARSESFVGCEKVSSGIDPAEGPRAIGFKKLANGAIGGGKGPDFIGGKDIRSFKADVVGTVSYQLVKAQFARGFQQSCPRSYKKAGSSL